MFDYRKRCVVPMMNNRTGGIDFEIVIYGRWAEELMTVPNDVIGSLARRYPDHGSSPFLLYNL